jgi:hypothetical protein
MKVIVLGGGLFGLSVALHLRKMGKEVIIIEKEKDILTKASKINQNRIHFGYHYPRSQETASQSLNGIVSFYHYFKDAISSNFENYYLVAENDSNVSAQQFIEFCDALGISHNEAYPDEKYINKDAMEASFLVREPIFDYLQIKRILKKLIAENNLEVLTNTAIQKIDYNGKQFKVSDSNSKIHTGDYVINATYSGVNEILNMVDHKINLKFQDVILPIYTSKHRIGLTLMDGPYCSILPKGKSSSQSILSNVKHSVIAESSTRLGLKTINYSKTIIDEHVASIYKESAYYFPFLKDEVNHNYNWRTVKALPINSNDARVSEIFHHPNLPNFLTILSGKVTTCWKIAFEINAIINNEKGFII